MPGATPTATRFRVSIGEMALKLKRKGIPMTEKSVTQSSQGCHRIEIV
jgi:hypothetical protein